VIEAERVVKNQTIWLPICKAHSDCALWLDRSRQSDFERLSHGIRIARPETSIAPTTIPTIVKIALMSIPCNAVRSAAVDAR